MSIFVQRKGVKSLGGPAKHGLEGGQGEGSNWPSEPGEAVLAVCFAGSSSVYSKLVAWVHRCPQFLMAMIET
jgi:hypothetical protein